MKASECPMIGGPWDGATNPPPERGDWRMVSLYPPGTPPIEDLVKDFQNGISRPGLREYAYQFCDCGHWHFKYVCREEGPFPYRCTRLMKCPLTAEFAKGIDAFLAEIQCAA